MKLLIIIAVLIIASVVVLRLVLGKKGVISFFTTGFDNGFKLSEILLLHQVALTARLAEPTALYWSVPALNQGIAYILKDARIRGVENTPRVQNFLSKLYKYRTKVELDPKNSHSLKTTKGLAVGQKIRIVVKSFGVFTSQVLNNGRELVISLPVQKNQVLFGGHEWIGRTISIYLQRLGDAGYVFDTTVLNSVPFGGKNALFLQHTDQLIRTQKRKSVRCACSVPAALYVVKSETMSRYSLETTPGLKCIIEDISEDGAMIRIGGMGRRNITIKLQFQLNDKWIVMFGIVRAVEFNQNLNQSRLHFECFNLPEVSRNDILTYVYNVLPQEQREVFEAIQGAENDSQEEAQAVAEAAKAAGVEGVPSEADRSESGNAGQSAADVGAVYGGDDGEPQSEPEDMVTELIPEMPDSFSYETGMDETLDPLDKTNSDHQSEVV
ncbi:MAG: PilZ domain-containing protein [Treponemataceae bacterium]|nr:PilZ domain-containing protein [Treponemataceae bacterium]